MITKIELKARSVLFLINSSFRFLTSYTQPIQQSITPCYSSTSVILQ